MRASLEAPWNANKHSAARSLVANPKRVRVRELAIPSAAASLAAVRIVTTAPGRPARVPDGLQHRGEDCARCDVVAAAAAAARCAHAHLSHQPTPREREHRRRAGGAGGDDASREPDAHVFGRARERGVADGRAEGRGVAEDRGAQRGRRRRERVGGFGVKRPRFRCVRIKFRTHQVVQRDHRGDVARRERRDARGTRRAGSAPTRWRARAPRCGAVRVSRLRRREECRREHAIERAPLGRQRVHLRLGPARAVGVVEQAHAARRPRRATKATRSLTPRPSRRRGGARPRRPVKPRRARRLGTRRRRNSSPSPAESRPPRRGSTPPRLRRGEAARGRARRGTSSPDTRAPQRAPPGARPAPR